MPASGRFFEAPVKLEFDALMQRMDDARAASLTPPESFFKKARQKQKAGDYDFAVDMEKSKTIKIL